jgi:CDP-diacylglycerol--glycerol-3-phosphate 3-phosphatidyltransferase
LQDPRPIVAADVAEPLHGTLLAALIFSIAAITDCAGRFFGPALRVWCPSFGKVMDPVADKLLVSCLDHADRPWVDPAWIVCVIIGREMAVTGLRNIMAEPAGCFRFQSGQIQNRLSDRGHHTVDDSLSVFGIDFQAIGMFFLWGALLFTVWSGATIFCAFEKLLETEFFC